MDAKARWTDMEIKEREENQQTREEAEEEETEPLNCHTMLNTEVWVEENKVQYEHYRKPS